MFFLLFLTIGRSTARGKGALWQQNAKRHRGSRCRLAVVILCDVKNLAYSVGAVVNTYAPMILLSPRSFPF